MSRTIKAYRIFLEKSGKELDFNLENFFKKINSIKTKFKKIENYPLALQNLQQFFCGYITFSIYKYRDDYKPYIEDIKTHEVKQIDARVVEITNVLYHSNFDVLLIENNIEGSNKDKIESYLNTFLPEEVSLKIEEIYCHYDIETIKKSDRIKYIELLFDSNIMLQQNLENNFIKNSLDISSIFLENSFKIGSDKISLKYDIEKYGGSLNKKGVSELLKNLSKNILINDIAVHFKNSNKKMVTVKMFQLQKPITFSILKSKIKKPSWEKIRDEMIEEYKINESICCNEIMRITEKVEKITENVEFIEKSVEELKIEF